MIDWLSLNFTDTRINKTTARRAIRHMKKREKMKLFSPDPSQMRAAEGRWYESLVYEMVLDSATRSDLIRGVLRKGADAPFPPKEVQIGQNGIFYSNRGDINIRGNGQDLAEVDLMLVDNTGSIAFAEIVTSPSDLKKLEEEISYKKTLLGYLYGQVSVPFFLFSSVDISRSSVVRRVVREPDSTLIVTKSCDELKSMLKPSDIRGIPRKPIRNPKLLDLTAVQPKRPFDYKQLHDQRKDKILSAIGSKDGFKNRHHRDEIPPLVKKILFGALYPSGIRALCNKTNFSVRNHDYNCDYIKKHFSKVILAVDIPTYDPVIYMRLRHKKEYLKMVPDKSGGFKMDSKRSARMKGFFLWLESIEPTLGANVTKQYADTFIG